MLTGRLSALQFDPANDLEPVMPIGGEALPIVGKNGPPADDLEAAEQLAQSPLGLPAPGWPPSHGLPEGDGNQVPVRVISRQLAGATR
jgi:hypothetical protein